MSSALRGLAPREGLKCLLVKMGRTGPLVEPRRGPQAGKSGDPRFQNTDNLAENHLSFPSAPRWVQHSYLSKVLRQIPYTYGPSRLFFGAVAGE